MFNFEKRHTTLEEIIRRKTQERYQKGEEEKKKKKEIPMEKTEEEKIKEIAAKIDEVYFKSIGETLVKWQLKNEFMYGDIDRFVESQFSPIVSEIKIEHLEKILNRFIKRGVGKEEYFTPEAGLVFSYLLNETFRKHIEEQKAKGVKPENIKVVEIKLNTGELEEPLSYLGRGIPEKLRLIIDGNARNSVGEKADGGQIIVNGDVGNGTGLEMENGLIIVKGNAGEGTGERMKNGKILIKKDCGERTGSEMVGGELDVVGRAEEFFLSSTFLKNIAKKFSQPAFSEKNKGKVIYMGRKIFENGKRIQSE